MLKKLLRNYLFVCSIVSISSLYFMVTGLQFWVSDYLQRVIKAPAGLVFTTFAFVSISAPFAGVILGGRVTQRIGGYAHRNAMHYCLALALLATGFSLLVPFLDDFACITATLWIVFFAGGALLPTLTGLMISSVPFSMRNSASAIAQFVEHLFGYLPGPLVYGYLNSDKEETNRDGMTCLMFSSLVGLASMAYSFYRRVCVHKTTPGKPANTEREMAYMNLSSRPSIQRIQLPDGGYRKLVELPVREFD